MGLLFRRSWYTVNVEALADDGVSLTYRLVFTGSLVSCKRYCVTQLDPDGVGYRVYKVKLLMEQNGRYAE